MFRSKGMNVLFWFLRFVFLKGDVIVFVCCSAYFEEDHHFVDVVVVVVVHLWKIEGETCCI